MPIKSFTRSAPVDSASTNVMLTRTLMAKLADTFTVGPIAQSPDVMPTHVPMGESVNALKPEPLLSDTCVPVLLDSVAS